MADVIRIKRRAVGGAAGPPSSLAAAELAYNEQDGKLYYGKGNSGGLATSIVNIGGETFSNLGTAAYKNTGTSGNTIPLLDAANTFGASLAVTQNQNGITSFSITNADTGASSRSQINVSAGTGLPPATGAQVGGRFLALAGQAVYLGSFTAHDVVFQTNGNNVMTLLNATQSVSISNAAIATGTVGHIDGTMAAPSMFFASQTDLGFYRSAINTINIASNNVARYVFGKDNVGLPEGNVTNPGIGFVNNPYSGLYYINSNNWAMGVASAKVADVTNTGISVVNNLSAGGKFLAANGAVGAPSISFSNSTDVGFYRVAANTIGLASNGTLILQADYSVVTINGMVRVANNIVCTVDNTGIIFADGVSRMFSQAGAGTYIRTANDNLWVLDTAGTTNLLRVAPAAFLYKGANIGVVNIANTWSAAQAFSAGTTFNAGVVFNGRINIPAASAVTIAAGVITLPANGSSWMTVDTEGAAATDDLDNISGGAKGDIIILQAANGGSRAVNVRNWNVSGGNITLANSAAFNLNQFNSRLCLFNYTGSYWTELWRVTVS
jgi:hypothetical protein